MWRLIFIYFLFFCECKGDLPEPVEPVIEVESQRIIQNEAKALSYKQALILGTIQGVTEFLPISSTGHLIIANQALRLDSKEILLNKSGDPILKIKKGEERAYTIQDAVNSYAIVIQGGTILAILFLYRKRIFSIFEGLIGRSPQGIKLLRNLILAFLPAACLGLILEHWIEKHLFSTQTVIIALIVGALVMFIVERIRTKKGIEIENENTLDLDELNVKQCLTIGGLQCLAMWPGTSRSMMTIVGGYIAGLSPAKAAEFSFLLGLITLSAASFYKIASDGPNMAKALSLGPAIFGCGIAFVTGAIAVKWLVNYLTKHGLGLFAWYRLILAVGIILANW